MLNLQTPAANEVEGPEKKFTICSVSHAPSLAPLHGEEDELVVPEILLNRVVLHCVILLSVTAKTFPPMLDVVVVLSSMEKI